MTPPRDRAARIVRWLMQPGDRPAQELEDRIAEEIGDALKELQDGFLRPAGGRGAPITQ